MQYMLAPSRHRISTSNESAWLPSTLEAGITRLLLATLITSSFHAWLPPFIPFALSSLVCTLPRALKVCGVISSFGRPDLGFGAGGAAEGLNNGSTGDTATTAPGSTQGSSWRYVHEFRQSQLVVPRIQT